MKQINFLFLLIILCSFSTGYPANNIKQSMSNYILIITNNKNIEFQKNLTHKGLDNILSGIYNPEEIIKKLLSDGYKLNYKEVSIFTEALRQAHIKPAIKVCFSMNKYLSNNKGYIYQLEKVLLPLILDKFLSYSTNKFVNYQTTVFLKSKMKYLVKIMIELDLLEEIKDVEKFYKTVTNFCKKHSTNPYSTKLKHGSYWII